MRGQEPFSDWTTLASQSRQEGVPDGAGYWFAEVSESVNMPLYSVRKGFLTARENHALAGAASVFFVPLLQLYPHDFDALPFHFLDCEPEVVI